MRLASGLGAEGAGIAPELCGCAVTSGVVGENVSNSTHHLFSIREVAKRNRQSVWSARATHVARKNLAGVQARRDATVQSEPNMLHAFKLYTGPDNASHVQEGTIGEHITTQVASIRFQESPPGS